jgi:cysteine desulfurase
LTAQRIYLDYNASTPIDPAVAAATRRFLEDDYGNPSSGHWASDGAKAALEAAGGQAATLLGATTTKSFSRADAVKPTTSSLRAYFAMHGKGDHIVTTWIEHPAIIEPCGFIKHLGARVTYLPVEGALLQGVIDMAVIFNAPRALRR